MARTLREASRAALAAAEAGDLDALQEALADRGNALAAGEAPGAGDLAEGQKAFALLTSLVRGLSIELSRLRQVEAGFRCGITDEPRVEIRG